jgi:hypothetical protein
MQDRQRPNQDDEIALNIQEYWERYAEAFAIPLRGNGLLGTFVSNPAVTGAYAEAWVHSLAASMVSNLTISTGAVIRTTDVVHGQDLRKVPQSDLIFWDPTEMPALFRTGDFALVHTQAARAIIEIKRTTSNVGGLQEQLKKQKLRLLSEHRRNVLGVVVAHQTPLFGEGLEPEWVRNSEPQGEVRVVRLLDKKTSKPDPEGIFALIYFLSHVARQSHQTASKRKRA